ncbi:DUF1189 family protein [Virgibacillus kekensis]|uniref:DUF1189 family protein n=1 Tax=Virgibacillus kekensis TaxID=202261 RepID=A0ABV9DLI1_9BACI
MIFLRAFIYSIKLPNKNAVFKLNRIGMDITVVYMFILLLVSSLPSLANQLTATSGSGSDMALPLKLVYFFIFYYLPLTVMVFLLLSLLAYAGTFIARMLKRKVRFPLLWKMSAYTSTIPLLVYTILAFVFAIGDTYLWLFMLYSLIFIVKIITVYPKRKIRN